MAQNELTTDSLSKLYDNKLQEFNLITSSDLSSSDEEFQKKVTNLIKSLEDITVKVSEISLFSCNEDYEELPTESLKMLLLPAFLGLLTLKLQSSDRIELLKVSEIYFNDYISRCNDYGLTTLKPLKENKSNSVRDIEAMNKNRLDKIERYKRKKNLTEQLKSLRTAINTLDEEDLRNYYISLIDYYLLEVLDEFSTLQMEKDMLIKMQEMKKKGISEDKKEENIPLKPFLITKNELKKKVFGAGYPSLPTYTVDEFYEQRVKDGIFPGNSSAHHVPTNNYTEEDENIQKEKLEENDDENNLNSLRSRDEWRDNHRRGWGNTYNRS